MLRVILFLTGSLFLFSCKNNSDTKQFNKANSLPTVKNDIHPGKKVLQNQCFVCHNNQTAENSVIAPPMIAIKAHYMRESTNEAEFTKALVSFLEKPTANKAKLTKAVKRFGLMPYQKYNKRNIENVANYLYNYQIEEPNWFKEHWNSHNSKPYSNTGKLSKNAQPKTKTELGVHYALSTKKVLGKNLMGKLQTEGTLEALNFCNENALSLTNTSAEKFQVKIQRVSDKPRNPSNTANKEELAIISTYKKDLATNNKLNAITSKNTVYYPIISNKMCMQCHGTKRNITPKVYKKIVTLYPNDKAIGYSPNQLRGIWKVTLNN